MSIVDICVLVMFVSLIAVILFSVFSFANMFQNKTLNKLMFLSIGILLLATMVKEMFREAQGDITNEIITSTDPFLKLVSTLGLVFLGVLFYTTFIRRDNTK